MVVVHPVVKRKIFGTAEFRADYQSPVYRW